MLPALLLSCALVAAAERELKPVGKLAEYTDAHGRKRGEAGFVDHDATDHTYVMKGHEIMPAGESFFREAVKLLDPRFVY